MGEGDGEPSIKGISFPCLGEIAEEFQAGVREGAGDGEPSVKPESFTCGDLLRPFHSERV